LGGPKTSRMLPWEDVSVSPKKFLRQVKTVRMLPYEDVSVSTKEFLGQAKTVRTALKYG
jgi:hypothetical protein